MNRGNKYKIGRIYVITNKVNGKQYVGQTVFSLKHRLDTHYRNAKDNKNKKYPFQSALLKYGKENFEIKLLEECTIEEINDREIYWIDKLDTYYHGYNATLGGDESHRYDYQEIVEIFQKEGKGNCQTTADIIGCSRHTVGKACNMYGIKPHIGEIPKYNLDEIYSFLAETKDRDKTLKHFQCSTDTLERACRKYNTVPSNICGKKDRSKNIYQCDLKGNIIKLHRNAYEASIDILGKESGRASIQRAAKNFETKTAYGYKWKYADSD